jgi:hypothetical protein
MKGQLFQSTFQYCTLISKDDELSMSVCLVTEETLLDDTKNLCCTSIFVLLLKVKGKVVPVLN